MMRCQLLALAILASCLISGCRSLPTRPIEERRAEIEKQIERDAVGEAPEIDAARERVAAALAREEGEVAFDSVELRAAYVHESDDKAHVLARLPLRNPFELAEQRQVRRAETELALAQLEEASLTERVARCVPSLDQIAQREREALFEIYSERHLNLLAWSRDLRRSGIINDVAATQFDLETRVKLSTRKMEPLYVPPHGSDSPRVFDVLPGLNAGAAPLESEPAFIRRRVVKHQPIIAAHRARRARLEALARREATGRWPTPRFVDVGFEPVAYPGDDRQVEARVAFEIPFGREARAGERRYRALARSERSAQAHTVRQLEREAAVALTTLNDFRARMSHWIELQNLADESDTLADRWMKDRLTGPDEVSSLIDSVYSARLAVLEARERAGRAGCAMVAATATTIAEWPSRAAGGSR